MRQPTDTSEIFQKIAHEDLDVSFLVRMGKTEREQLARLAQIYKIPMAQVVRFLIHQAVIDYAVDGEVFALAK